ncbi:hypothetical protein E2C01_081948 [Portunus trituberculatus]|uniref:Uncharacterized protein n=1 Tax=Portunus trituberculatus TaxID=210409 RepID=A0A5B7J092_PORTR|nr:hypothetical protein [Portunus trituberculatus]
MFGCFSTPWLCTGGGQTVVEHSGNNISRPRRAPGRPGPVEQLGAGKNDPRLMKVSRSWPKTVTAQTDSCRAQSPFAPHIKVAFLSGVFFSLEAVISGKPDGGAGDAHFAGVGRRRLAGNEHYVCG